VFDPCQDVLHLLETESPPPRSSGGSPINDIFKSELSSGAPFVGETSFLPRSFSIDSGPEFVDNLRRSLDGSVGSLDLGLNDEVIRVKL
jgi:hypothetical protein